APLDGLWNSAPASAGTFSWQHTARLPEPARRFLEHAIAPDTPLASELRMHGEIKLGRWLPATARRSGTSHASTRPERRRCPGARVALETASVVERQRFRGRHWVVSPSECN